jgi:hypothetical protein
MFNNYSPKAKWIPQNPAYKNSLKKEPQAEMLIWLGPLNKNRFKAVFNDTVQLLKNYNCTATNACTVFLDKRINISARETLYDTRVIKLQS